MREPSASFVGDGRRLEQHKLLPHVGILTKGPTPNHHKNPKSTILPLISQYTLGGLPSSPYKPSLVK